MNIQLPLLLHSAWAGQQQLCPYIFIFILAHHYNYGDMLIRHLLPGVRLVFFLADSSVLVLRFSDWACLRSRGGLYNAHLSQHTPHA